METPLVTAAQLVQSAYDTLKAADKSAVPQSALQSLEASLNVLHGLDPYLEQVSSAGPSALHDLIKETETHDFDTPYKEKKLSFPVSAKWSAGAYEGNFVAKVAKSTRAKRVLEVGMFTGTTTLAVADALPKDGKVVTLEIDSYLRDLAMPFFEKGGVKDKIDVRIGKAMDSIKGMTTRNEEPFDLIFIDADKGSYQAYFDALMDGQLLRKGGSMLVDNTLYKASPFTPQLQQLSRAQLRTDIDFDNGRSLAAFNKSIRDDARVSVTVLPVRDGVSWIMLNE